nr:uncharacterized protein LOC113822670 [Penaeus vannamei]
MLYLKQFCCVVDLEVNKLIFRRRIETDGAKHLTCWAQINGHDVEVFLDTGFTSTMDGTLEDATKLGLTLEDVSDQNLFYEGIRERCLLQYVACDVPLVLFGQEHRGNFFVCPFQERQPLVVGIRYLKGSAFIFNEDQTWVVTGPSESAPEAPGTSRVKAARLW